MDDKFFTFTSTQEANFSKFGTFSSLGSARNRLHASSHCLSSDDEEGFATACTVARPLPDVARPRVATEVDDVNVVVAVAFEVVAEELEFEVVVFETVELPDLELLSTVVPTLRTSSTV